MTLDVPGFVTLSDGTTAQVKGVAAAVVDGRLAGIVYTVEKASGAWAEVAGEDVSGGSPHAMAHHPAPDPCA